MTTLPIFFIGSRLSTGSCRGEHCSPAGFTRLVDLPGWLQRAAYMPPPDCRKTFFDFMHHLRPIEWFVGNGLDRSVPLCQRHDVTRKPRAIRRDFMRCARPDVRMGQDPSLQISRKRTFSTSCGRHICRPYGVPVMFTLSFGRGRGIPRPYRAMFFYCPCSLGL